MKLNDFLTQYPGMAVSFGTETGDVYHTAPGFRRPIEALQEWLAEDDAPTVLWCDVFNADFGVVAEWRAPGDVVVRYFNE